MCGSDSMDWDPSKPKSESGEDPESLAQGPRPRSEGPECPVFFQEQMEAAAVQVMEEWFCLFLDFLEV